LSTQRGGSVFFHAQGGEINKKKIEKSWQKNKRRPANLIPGEKTILGAGEGRTQKLIWLQGATQAEREVAEFAGGSTPGFSPIRWGELQIKRAGGKAVSIPLDPIQTERVKGKMTQRGGTPLRNI